MKDMMTVDLLREKMNSHTSRQGINPTGRGQSRAGRTVTLVSVAH